MIMYEIQLEFNANSFYKRSNKIEYILTEKSTLMQITTDDNYFDKVSAKKIL